MTLADDTLENWRIKSLEARVQRLEDRLNQILFAIYAQVTLGTVALLWHLATNGGKL